MKKVIKSRLGYKEVETSETHIILAVDEYYDLLNEIDELKSSEMNKQLEIENLKSQFLNNIEKENYKKNEIINNLQLESKNLLDEINKLNNLNKNLIRICKERANAERKILNKKKHCGYICISQELYKFNNSEKKFNKIILQTPYRFNLNIENVRDLVIHDFKDRILEMLDYEEIVNYYDFTKNLYSYDDNKKYLVYKSLKTYKNFWNIDIYINVSDVIPAEFFNSADLL